MFKAQKDYYRLFKTQRDLEFFSMVLAMLGLLIGVINYEKDIREHTEPISTDDYLSALEHPRNRSGFSLVCRWTICVTSIISIIVLFFK